MQQNSSFRDPVSQVYIENGIVKRQIMQEYEKEYNHLMQSGLYSELVNGGWMVSHTQTEVIENRITPEQIHFISYPYEWCFSMLKDAALTTLKVNEIALKHGMMLKDATAFNVQYHRGRMVFIDTTSFMFYTPGTPWGAYRQFCQHFLYPLLCMKHLQANVWKGNLDGISAEQAVKILPNHCRFIPAYFAHVYAQAMKSTVTGQRQMKLPPIALMALLNHLEKFVRSLEYKGRSDWTGYADAGSYTDKAEESKYAIVSAWLKKAKPGYFCDLGANLGKYSRLAAACSHDVIAVDSDHDCIESINKGNSVFPLVIDLCNPTPAIGWENTERKSFLDRLHVDTILALALIHHLCIGNNVPLARVAKMFSEHCRTLIIEFVPPIDKQAVKLRGSKNIPQYDFMTFLTAFDQYFRTVEQKPIVDSGRTLFLMEKR